MDDRPVVDDAVSGGHGATRRGAARGPLLVRLLRLRSLQPTGWQRAAVGDLPILVAVVLVLGDLASAWTLLALPATVLALVKFHDAIESGLHPRVPDPAEPRPFGLPPPPQRGFAQAVRSTRPSA